MEDTKFVAKPAVIPKCVVRYFVVVAVFLMRCSCVVFMVSCCSVVMCCYCCAVVN